MQRRDPNGSDIADPWRDHRVDFDALAKKMGVSEQTLRHWRGGYRRMSVVQVWELSQASGIDPEQLFWHHLRKTLKYEAFRKAKGK